MGAMMRMALMIAIRGTMLLGVASTPSHAEVKYITDGAGMIEITGSDYDIWKAGNLVPRPPAPRILCTDHSGWVSPFEPERIGDRDD